MAQTVLIRGARQLLTLHGPAGPRRRDSLRQLGIIEDGALLISDGIITNIGPTRRIENLAGARSALEINATGRVVMPGFVDSHTHLIAAPPRVDDARTAGYGTCEAAISRKAADLSAGYIRRTSAPALEHHARRLLAGLARHGTTSVEVKTGYGLDDSGEMKMLRVLSHLSQSGSAQPSLTQSGLNVIPTFFAPYIAPPEFEGTLDEHVSGICEKFLRKLKARKLAAFVDGFCDPDGYSVAQTHALLLAARRFGLAAKLHAELTKRMGVVPMAVELGVVCMQGLNCIDASDATVLARSHTVAVLAPGPMRQDCPSRLPPARMLVDEGAALALASAFCPTYSSTYNMMTVVSMACLQMGMTIEEAISAATINGAHAMMRSSQAGSLEFGKEADLLILGVSDYREIPYCFGVNLVALTMRRGKVIYREGEVS